MRWPGGKDASGQTYEMLRTEGGAAVPQSVDRLYPKPEGAWDGSG